MPEIRISTKLDSSGLEKLNKYLDDAYETSKRVVDVWKSAPKWDFGERTGATHGGVHATQSPPHRQNQHASTGQSHGGMHYGSRQAPRNQNLGVGYNLNTPSGVISYFDNVVLPASPMLRNLNGSSGISNVAGVRYQGRPVQRQTNNVTSSQITNWFQSLSTQFQKMDRETQLAYLSAADRASNSTASFPSSIQQFYKEYGGGLGGPTQSISHTPISQSFGQRFGQHFMNNMGSESLGSAVLGGLKGGIGGSIIDAVSGSSGAGAMGAGAIGDLMGGPVGAIAAVAVQQIVSWIGGQVSNGLQAYSDSATSFSQFGHALGDLGSTVKSASTAVENFRSSTLKAGATVGMNASQSTQAASMMIQAYGGRVGTTGIKNLTQQVGTLALHSGLSSSEAAQIDALGATLGITSGVGKSMNNLGFNQMLENATARAGMQGRQGSFYTGLMGVYSGIQAQTPIITSAATTAGQYTALNRSGIQGLQGQNATNIMNTMNASMNTPGFGQMMAMEAIYKASGGKITNPFQMMAIINQGTGAKIGNTTLGAEEEKMAKQMGGNNKYTQAGIFSVASGLSESQALDVMFKTNFANARGISTHGSSYQPNTITDVNNIGKSEIAARASKLGNIGATMKSWASRLGWVPTGSTLAGAQGSFASKFTGSPPPNNVTPTPQTEQGINNALNKYGSKGAALYGQLTNIMPAIAYYESGFNPYVINDNTTGQQYGVKKKLTKSQYLKLADKLQAQGHQLALGEYQLENKYNGKSTGVTPENAINPTFAAQRATGILLNDYKATGQNWTKALEDYNGGVGMRGTAKYAKEVSTLAKQYTEQQQPIPVSFSQTDITALAQAIAQSLATYFGGGPSS